MTESDFSGKIGFAFLGPETAPNCPKSRFRPFFSGFFFGWKWLKMKALSGATHFAKTVYRGKPGHNQSDCRFL